LDETGDQAAQALPRWLLLAVSLWGGLQIMVLEICGFRVLQTNLGSSVLVTGTLLTLVMVLLSAGYYTGGVLSARWRNARGLFALLVASAAYAAVLNGPLLEPVASLGMVLRNALGSAVYLQSAAPAALLTLLLYGPPVFLMSMISPYLIRLRTLGSPSAGADPGLESGFFMSLSTAGSIFGTLLSSYLSVPFFGVTVTALATSAVFFVLAAYGWLRAGPAPERAPLVRAARV